MTGEQNPKPIPIPASSPDLSAPEVENNAKSITAKASAANKIKERLQKKAVQDAEQVAKAQAEGMTLEDIQAEKKSDIVQFYEVQLTQEWAQIWEALRKKIASEEDVIQALFDKTKLEKEGKNVSVLDLVKERQGIPEEHYAQLQKVEAKTIKLKGKPPKPSGLDLMLGQLVVEYKMLEREEMQQVLRAQAYLFKIGIKKPLQDILKASRIIAEEMVDSLVAQCQKEAGERKGEVEVEQKTVSVQAVFSKPQKKYVLAQYSLVILLLLLVAIFAAGTVMMRTKPKPIYVGQITGQDFPKPPDNPTNPPINRPRPPEERLNAPDVPPPDDTKPEPSQPEPEKFNPEEAERKYMTAKGLEKWGKFWIPREQFEEMAQKWQPGSKPEKLSFDFKPIINYLVRDEKPGLVIRGKLDLPTLPKGMQLTMNVQMLHATGEGSLYLSKEFVLESDHSFRVILAPLPKPLLLGVYTFRFSMLPEWQSEFLREFLDLKTPQVVLAYLTVGENEEIQKFYKANVSRIEAIFNDLKNQHQRISVWIDKNKKMTPEELENLKKSFASKQKEIQQKIEQYQGIGLIPTFQKAESDILSLFQGLEAMFLAFRNWQAAFSFAPPALLEQQIKYSLALDASRISLRQEQSRMFSILKEKAGENQ